MLRRMTGQESNDTAHAAGQAAYDRAATSAWPPTKTDVEAIGAAAGAVVGTALGGPVGTIVGTAVGGFVGGVAYDLINAIPSAGDNPLARFMVALKQVGAARNDILAKLAESCGTNTDAQWEALQEWGAEPLCQEGSDCRRDWANHFLAHGEASTYALLDQKNQSFFRAAAAQTAVCETRKQTGGKSKNSIPAVITLGIVSFVGLGLLQRFVTRGKF